MLGFLLNNFPTIVLSSRNPPCGVNILGVHVSNECSQQQGENPHALQILVLHNTELVSIEAIML